MADTLVERLRREVPNSMASTGYLLHVNPDGPQAADEIERLERIIARRDRLAETSRTFWVRAAKAAMAGDMRELRNRVDMAEAPPVDVVLSGDLP